MDDLTAQERHLIMTLRHLMSFTVIVHRNERWRIVLADQETCRIETGEGEDFGSRVEFRSLARSASVIDRSL